MLTEPAPPFCRPGDCDAAQSDAVERLMLESAVQSKPRDLDADVDECEPNDAPMQYQTSSQTAVEQRRRLKR